MDKKTLKHIIDVAAGRKPADLCIKNVDVVDVYNKEVFRSNVYVASGYIAGFGADDFPAALTTVDATGKYMTPGFIDSHLHIESSHLSPCEYSRLVVPCGTTTVVADPHEICNVCGTAGLDYMLKASEKLPLSIYYQFPSCVPCTPFEHSGAVLKADSVAKRIDNPRVMGLGELMDFYGVKNADLDILDKLIVCKNAGKIIDGHSPGLSGTGLDAYSASGVKNDHECANAQELKDRIRRGMYVLVRQGTVCHDLVNLLKGVNANNAQWCLFCTDDCQAKTMLETGHIDNNVRMAIEEGLDPISAICMATINAATCFHMTDRGAIAPGMRADFLLVSSLDKNMKVEDVYTAGNHVASNKKYLVETKHIQPPKSVSGRMKIKNLALENFALKLKSDKVVTIDVIPGSVVTAKGCAEIKRDENGFWRPDDQDICKVAVLERHHGTGNVGLGLFSGFGLKGGAVATTVAHDSHNCIVAGDNDADMLLAVQTLVELGGGMAVVKGGKVLDSVQHEIAGLMTDIDGETVAKKLANIQNTAREQLCIHDDVDPFMTLCFMSLIVIPEIKITDTGLFDVIKYKFIPVEA